MFYKIVLWKKKTESNNPYSWVWIDLGSSHIIFLNLVGWEKYKLNQINDPN